MITALSPKRKLHHCFYSGFLPIHLNGICRRAHLISMCNQLAQKSVSCERKNLVLVRLGLFCSHITVHILVFFGRLIMLMLCVLWERQSLTTMME